MDVGSFRVTVEVTVIASKPGLTTYFKGSIGISFVK